MKKTGIKALVLSLIGVVIFAVWYKAYYSMEIAIPFEINNPSESNKILIASQGSEFKNQLVASITDSLKLLPVYIKVIDVSLLPEIVIENWNVVILLHTWEIGKPPNSVQNFVNKNETSTNIIVMTTSGNGKEAILGIDAISGASDLTTIPSFNQQIVKRVKLIVDNGNQE
jgi:hypothetical protein